MHHDQLKIQGIVFHIVQSRNITLLVAETESHQVNKQTVHIQIVCLITNKVNELAHEIMALFVLRKLILQMHMRSQFSGARCLIFLVGPIIYFHTSCVRTATALARLRECAGSPEPPLVAYVISTIIS